MSHGLSPVTIKDVPLIVSAKPFTIPTASKVVLGALVVLGVVGFGLEVSKGTPQHAWVALHINFIYWLCIAAASTCFSSALHICNAQWVRPIRRLFEAGSSFFLISPLFLIILYMGHHYMFSWAHQPVPGKGIWLTGQYLYTRDALAILILIYLGRHVVKLSIRRDILAIRGGLTGLSEGETARWRDKRYDCYVENSTNDAIGDIRKSHGLMGRFSPAVIIVYALAMSLVAFDQVMSVDPLWYSTMFGGFIFMGAVYLAMAWTSMIVGFSRSIHPLFTQKIERRTLHDLGKLLFGFGIFWAYLFWCHYLPIWYGNMPEETGWIILRLREQPWHDFAWIVLGLCFIIPFMLGLNRDLKQVPRLLFATGAIVAVGMWLQHYLLFVPTLSPTEIPLNFTDLSVTLGFFGIYMLSVAHFLERAPLMPFGDLYLPETPLR